MERSLRLAEQMRDMLRRTLALSGGRKLDRRPISALEAGSDLQYALEQRARSRQVRFACAVDTALSDFEADWPLLKSALLSLAEAAIDSLTQGGGLGIEFDLLPTRALVRIQVWDTGPGVWEGSEVDTTDDFSDLGSGSSDSIGFGLSVARSVVRAHDGRIRLGRRPDGGNVVSIEIPLRTPVADRESSADLG
jgi:K+-sensing histidine kinase KdpD